MPYKFSRRSTQLPVRHTRRGATLVNVKRKVHFKSSYRKKPMRYKRFGRTANSSRYTSKVRGKYLTDNPTPMSRLSARVTHGLSDAGVIEKRLIPHNRWDYQRNGKIFTNNPKLDLMSGAYLQYGFTNPTASDINLNNGISIGNEIDAFTIAAAGGSRDRYAFYKNFQTEIVINTINVNYLNGATAPVLTSEQIAACANPLNFRVLLLQKKPDARNNNYAQAATANPLNEVLWSNSLLQGYDESPYGPIDSYAGSGASNVCAQQDLLWGKMNFKHYRVLEDRKFSLSVPQSSITHAVPTTIGGQAVRSEQKLPTMKKLVFSHPINQKVQVTAQGGTAVRPIDMNTQFFALILCGLPNVNIQAVAVPPAINPTTVGLWNHSVRGFTSYLDA